MEFKRYLSLENASHGILMHINLEIWMGNHKWPELAQKLMSLPVPGLDHKTAEILVDFPLIFPLPSGKLW